MWVMVAGPYGSGAASDAERAQNLENLNRAALELFRRGHVPIIGVNNALPLTHSTDENVMMPLSLKLVERCDACLRIGGPSKGADMEVDAFRKAGKPVYYALKDIP